MPKDVGGADVSTASATEDLSEEVTLELQPTTGRVGRRGLQVEQTDRSQPRPVLLEQQVPGQRLFEQPELKDGSGTLPELSYPALPTTFIHILSTFCPPPTMESVIGWSREGGWGLGTQSQVAPSTLWPLKEVGGVERYCPSEGGERQDIIEILQPLLPSLSQCGRKKGRNSLTVQ